jgi:hypothetical protein
MRSKRNKPKKYFGGGMLLQAGLAGAQALHGIHQRKKAEKEYARLKASAPSLDTPEQYYENYKNAYDSQLARMETDAINRAYGANLDALQSGGGRALVGGLGSIEAQRQMGMNKMLADERAMRMQAGQQLAAAESEAQGRKIDAFNQERARVEASFQAGTQNIGQAIAGGAENMAYQSMANKMLGEEQKPGVIGSVLNQIGGKYAKMGANFLAKTFLEDGGMMTKGKFSHKDNPIHLIQNGEKVGEATGGEYVINPEQAKQIAEQSEYARKLFKKFAKEAKKK